MASGTAALENPQIRDLRFMSHKKGIKSEFCADPVFKAMRSGAEVWRRRGRQAAARLVFEAFIAGPLSCFR